jgi:hypothetical protein
VDGANPDSGVNKEFVVSKFPALTHVSDAEVQPFFGLFRALSSALLLQQHVWAMLFWLGVGLRRVVVQRQRQHQGGVCVQSDA